MRSQVLAAASDTIRVVTRLCRQIDDLAMAGDAERAAKAARTFTAALRAASERLSTIDAKPTKESRATRWQGISRANYMPKPTTGEDDDE